MYKRQGQQRKVHRAPLILQRDPQRRAAVLARDVDPAVAQQAAGEREPLGRVVVAAHRKHLVPGPGQGGEEPVQQLHRFRRRHRLVVQISGQKSRVDVYKRQPRPRYSP